jgi:2-polyprenyl-3-methyl-5-hydroxy-6-metoxy-1,4-benzoquinol methylase
MDYYKDKVQQYFTNARFDLISLLPNNNNSKILEVGAGGGDTLIAIKELKLANEVVGIELFDLPDTNQQNQNIDYLIIGDIEKPNFSLPEEYFDFIICGDVIEHLVDPWTAIEFLSKSLKPGGQFIVSMPNIRYYKAFIKIYIKGDFEYEEKGVFDKTHARFFCKKNMMALFEKNKFSIDRVLPLNFFSSIKGILYYFNKFTFSLFEEFINTQYVMVVTKKIN